MQKPLIIIGYWHPKPDLALEDGPFKLNAASRSGWELRQTFDNLQIARHFDSIASGWHRDAGATIPYVITWSDAYPTEIKVSYKGSSVIRPAPYAVVLFDNVHLSHRVSQDYIALVREGQEPERNFLRAHIYVHPSRQRLTYWRHELARRSA